ncbi:kinase-like domain-containing protein [Podospora australis]|uniref:non-specific serine/threonine protein kinase n=1 Tax=Podospora australis TaxID=1536484 RepID=A0AAN7AMG2_9PEZI|nr:kinase-like domain-containing protein [Podospora australis]
MSPDEDAQNSQSLGELTASQRSDEGSISQSWAITLNDYIGHQDDSYFIWDELDRETSDAWNNPVIHSGLDSSKHKVFHHCNKEYLKPPHPFIQDGHELGDSGSTIVYKVRCPDEYSYRRPLALKIIVCKENARPPGPDSDVRKLALQEVKTMASIRHPHIVVYVASFEDYCISTREVKQRRGRARAVFKVDQQIKKHILGIAMYPPAQCNLNYFMNLIISRPDDMEYRAALHTYFGCLAQAVAFLHRVNIRIRHKDIKPENVVIDDFLLPVLTDFGLSKHFENGQHSEGPTPKTLKYADPEAIQETKRDERSDVFSLGCVYLEMATTLLGESPHFAEQQLCLGIPGEFKYSECLDHLDAYLALLSRKADVLIANDPSKQAASAEAIKKILPVIRAMMDEDHTRRPFAKDLYPFFRHLYDVYPDPGPCKNCEAERRTGTAVPTLRRNGSQSPVITRTGTMNTSIVARRQSMRYDANGEALYTSQGSYGTGQGGSSQGSRSSQTIIAQAIATLSRGNSLNGNGSLRGAV